MTHKKVAIIHDWLVTNGGAEKVLKELLDIFPNAEIFSIVNFLNEQDKIEIIKNKKVTTSFIQKLPFSKKYFRNYLFLFPKAVESFNLEEFELIISSSWAFAKGIKKPKNAIHICYCYTPIRYAWDLYDEYTKDLFQPKKFFVQMVLKYIRKWDLKTNENIDFFIAISKYVQNRIKRIYKRDSILIYPPVDIKSFTPFFEKKDFYITVSRLVPYKKTKLIVEAFNKMPNKKLIIIGDGEEYKNIKKIAANNIILLGYLEKKKVVYYLQRAKAYVYAAIEDFGIAPIEALSCATPVIALNEGGTKETIVDGECGVLFKEQSTEAIIDAVKKFEKIKFDLNKVYKYSRLYINFKNDFKNFISLILD